MGFVRKYLSKDGLIKIVKHSLAKEQFNSYSNLKYSWEDCILSGLAVFGLKMPSLLQFDKLKSSDVVIKRNLKNLYGVDKAPSDTCMRERLDQVLPSQLRGSYKKIFAYLQRGKVLESFSYLDGGYIISVDGTGQYSSNTVSCDNCCEKHHSNGDITYYHHMLGAVLVHPERKEVIPFAPESIVKIDGQTKNDCERNASKRLLLDLRREHPHLKIIIVEDGIAANYPHLSLLDALKMQYVISVKSGDHKFLFDWINALKPEIYQQEERDGTKHVFNYYNNVPLNDANYEYSVNVLEYWETSKNGKTRYFSWITSMPIKATNVYKIMRAGRCRWRIENATFNTLKNQGYNFEHNYGHGYKNLCSVMTMLMMLAFLIDQVRQICCEKYQKARIHSGPLYALFEKTRVLVELFIWDSWEALESFIGNPGLRAPPKSAIEYA